MPPKKTAPPPTPAQLPLLLGAAACNPWECDVLGHMNVRFYLQRAQRSWGALAAAIKLPNAFHREAISTLLPRDIHMRCHHEVRAGDFVVVRGGVAEIGDDHIVLYQELRKGFTDAPLAATYRIVLDHVDSKTGRAFPWSQKTRDALQQYRIEAIPLEGAPRSFDLKAPTTPISLTRADALDAPLIGLTTLQADECDAFGRMRAEALLGIQSDSWAGAFSAYRNEAEQVLTDAGYAARPSGALVEARVTPRRWPKAGDIIQVRGGLADVGPKTFRPLVWAIDPVSGECWWANETLLVNFDTQARKAFEAPDAYLALLKRHVVAGLTL